MRKLVWLWLVLVGVIGISAMVIVSIKVNFSKESLALREQLRLARAEGIPTTFAQFAALIPPAKPSENAAPLYRQLHNQISHTPFPSSVGYKLLFKLDPQTLAQTKAYLQTNRTNLETIDLAVKRPRCWFNRDWTQGYAVLFPELADVKAAARLLLLRASLEAAQHDPAAAIADAKRAFAISRQVGEEPEIIGRLIEQAIWVMTARDIAYWAYAHPNSTKYKSALAQGIQHFPMPNLEQEHLGELPRLLQFYDQCKTPAGWKELGISSQSFHVDSKDRLISLVIGRGKGKADIVKAFREYWASLTKARSQRQGPVKKAVTDLYAALWSNPVAGKLFEELSGGESPWLGDREGQAIGTRQAYVAALRALSGAVVPKTIKTDDLLSPFDGKPLRYSCNGKQIIIQVSDYSTEDGKPLILKIPPDPPLEGR